MDDVGKAIIMAGQVLMFVFAATISIYLYNTLTSNIDNFMLAGNYSNRGDAIVDVETIDTKRSATKAEIIMAILDLKSKYEKTGDANYRVEAGGRTYSYDASNDAINIDGANTSFNTFTLRNRLNNNIADVDYEVSYDENGKTLTYTIK